jgi:hypothetical protein
LGSCAENVAMTGERRKGLHSKPARSASSLAPAIVAQYLGCELGQVNEIGLSPSYAKTPICR